jgi:hypothetical protein
MGFKIEWRNRGGKPVVPPNPRYPDGIDVDISQGATPSCYVPLPYPTGKDTVGGWFIECEECGLTAYVTAASRSDDPRSVKLPCKERLQ